MTQPKTSQWIVYPPADGKFLGFWDKDDPSRMPELAAFSGRNTTPNQGDRISIRPYGYQLFPTDGTFSTSMTPTTTLWVFHLRDGTQVLIGAQGTNLVYFDEGSQTYVTFSSGYTSADFGFAEMNINTDLASYLYFGNGVQDFSRWTGAHTDLNGALVGGETTIPVDSTTNFPTFGVTTLTAPLTGAEMVIPVVSTDGFGTTGTIRINGTPFGYISKDATNFTLSAPIGIIAASGTPVGDGTIVDIFIDGVAYSYDYYTATTLLLTSAFSGTAPDDAAVYQAVETYPNNPKGNIYLAFDNRLFIAGNATAPQSVNFSAYADATDFASADVVSASTATNPGIFNLVEGGGAVTAMCCDEQSLYMFKENIIYNATLTDSFYSLTPLKPFDGRSQTTGAKSKRSVFVGGNRIFFVSKDNQIYSLQRVETIDYPQMVPISQPIQPTVNNLDFSSLSGIVYGISAYFACKSSTEISFNDVVLVFNMNNGTWDTPVNNINASDWAVYKVNGVERLLFGDANSPNIWITTAGATDYSYSTVAEWTTPQYNFGQESTLKELDNVFIEGYIDVNTKLNVTLLYDDEGFSGTLSTTITGDENQYLFGLSSFNTFGAFPFGLEPFGSNEDNTGLKKFRIYLNKNLRRTPFFTVQLKFTSDGNSQNWQVIRYGFLVRPHSEPIPTNLFRNW